MGLRSLVRSGSLCRIRASFRVVDGYHSEWRVSVSQEDFFLRARVKGEWRFCFRRHILNGRYVLFSSELRPGDDGACHCFA